jgi:putative transposase
MPRERQMRGFRDPERSQAFLSSFGPIRQKFESDESLAQMPVAENHPGEPEAAVNWPRRDRQLQGWVEGIWCK